MEKFLKDFLSYGFTYAIQKNVLSEEDLIRLITGKVFNQLLFTQVEDILKYQKNLTSKVIYFIKLKFPDINTQKFLSENVRLNGVVPSYLRLLKSCGVTVDEITEEVEISYSIERIVTQDVITVRVERDKRRRFLPVIEGNLRDVLSVEPVSMKNGIIYITLMNPKICWRKNK